MREVFPELTIHLTPRKKIADCETSYQVEGWSAPRIGPVSFGINMTIDAVTRNRIACNSNYMSNAIDDEAEVVEDYPELEKEDIRAALLYASKLVDEERVYAVGTH